MKDVSKHKMNDLLIFCQNTNAAFDRDLALNIVF